MNLGLSGKVVLMAGAASGTGAAVALVADAVVVAHRL